MFPCSPWTRLSHGFALAALLLLGVTPAHAQTNAPTFSKEGAGWYVLPGATRIFEVPITAGECSSTTAVAVELFGRNTSLKGAGQVSPAACAAR